MSRRYLFFILVFFISIFMAGFTNYNEADEKNELTIMIVPLDDRPVNTDFPKAIADIAKVDILLPPNEILGGRHKKADIESIKQWALENSKYADSFIISLTMTNHGGLIHSRMLDNDNFVIDLDWLRELNDKNPGKEIYAFDTIQRLSVSVDNKYEKELYDNIQNWAKNYMITDRNKLKALEEKIPGELKNKYLYSRAVNLSFNLEAINLVQEGVIDYLVLSQDDAAEKGIHLLDQQQIKNKIHELGVEDKTSMIIGTDEVELNLLMRHILKHYNYSPKVSVQYINENKKGIILSYEDRPLDKTIIEHIELAGASYVSYATNNADLYLFVYNSIENETITLDFIKKIKEYIESGKTVGIIDLSNNLSKSSANDFVSLLRKNINLSDLGSYSAWNTASNASGISISHLLAYWHSKRFLLGTEQYHQKFLYNRFMNDYVYKVKIKPVLESYLISTGSDVHNLDASYGKSYLESYITDHFIKLQSDFLMEFDDVYWDKIAIKKVELPWDRLFEIRIVNYN